MYNSNYNIFVNAYIKKGYGRGLNTQTPPATPPYIYEVKV